MTYTASKTRFEFTETHDVKSSAVDTLTYNENTQELAVDLHNEVYVYPGVSRSRFIQLLGARSIGRDYRVLKDTYGPARKLGTFGSVEFVPVRIAFATPASKVAPVTVASAQTFPLSFPSASVAPSNVAVAGEATFTVDFEVEGLNKEYTPKGVASVDEAIEALREASDALGLEVLVKGVYVAFE